MDYCTVKYKIQMAVNVLLYTLLVLFIMLIRFSLADDVLCPRHPIVQTSQVLTIQDSMIMPARREKFVEMFFIYLNIKPVIKDNEVYLNKAECPSDIEVVMTLSCFILMYYFLPCCFILCSC